MGHVTLSQQDYERVILGVWQLRFEVIGLMSVECRRCNSVGIKEVSRWATVNAFNCVHVSRFLSFPQKKKNFLRHAYRQHISLGIQWFGHQANHAFPSSVTIMNLWSYTFTPLCIFTAWCLIQQTYIFSFYLHPFLKLVRSSSGQEIRTFLESHFTAS